MNQNFESSFKSNIKSNVSINENADGSISVFFKQYRNIKSSAKDILFAMIWLPALLFSFVFTVGFTIVLYFIFIHWFNKSPRITKEIKVIPNIGIMIGDKKVSVHDIDAFGMHIIQKRTSIYAPFVSLHGNEVYLTGYTDLAVAEKVTSVIKDLLGFN